MILKINKRLCNQDSAIIGRKKNDKDYARGT